MRSEPEKLLLPNRGDVSRLACLRRDALLIAAHAGRCPRSSPRGGGGAKPEGRVSSARCQVPGAESWCLFVLSRAARRAHRGACSPGRSPRPVTTAGRRPSMAGWEHTPRCTRRASCIRRLRHGEQQRLLPASPATGPRSCAQRSPVLRFSGSAREQRWRQEVVDRHDGPTFFAVGSSRADDGSGPAVDAGGCPEPAMDGRRPDVGAGRGDIRLGIPLWTRRAARAPTRPVLRLQLWLQRWRCSGSGSGSYLTSELRSPGTRFPRSDGTPQSREEPEKNGGPKPAVLIARVAARPQKSNARLVNR